VAASPAPEPQLVRDVLDSQTRFAITANFIDDNR
jgi:hypothetical protein